MISPPNAWLILVGSLGIGLLLRFDMVPPLSLVLFVVILLVWKIGAMR